MCPVYPLLFNPRALISVQRLRLACRRPSASLPLQQGQLPGCPRQLGTKRRGSKQRGTKQWGSKQRDSEQRWLVQN